MTGGRLARLREHLNDEPFYITYGDGLAALDIRALADFHAAHGRHALARSTWTARWSRSFTKSRQARRRASTAAFFTRACSTMLSRL